MKCSNSPCSSAVIADTMSQKACNERREKGLGLLSAVCVVHSSSAVRREEMVLASM